MCRMAVHPRSSNTWCPSLEVVVSGVTVVELTQLKAGFGLPESPRLWYLEYKDTIEDGLKELTLVPGLFRAFHNNGGLDRAMASVHVDAASSLEVRQDAEGD